MSSDGDARLHSPVPTKKYKLYKSDPSITVPLRTLSRWEKNNSSSSDDRSDHDAQNSPCTAGNAPNTSNHSASQTESLPIDCSPDADINIFGTELLNHRIGDEISEGNENYFGSGDDDDQLEDKNATSDHDELYENSTVSVDQAVLNLLDFYGRHNVTKAALNESLQMQLKIIPKNNRMPKTLFKLLQYVKKVAPPCRVIKHYYCKKCSQYISVDDGNLLKCSVCNTSEKRATSFFFEFDIFDQIRFMFENNNLAQKLKPPKLSNISNNISDIVDGSEYIRVNSRPHRNKNDLTLILNTDGLSLVKSAKSNCWPLMYIIAELPQKIRESFVIIAGLWYDNEYKPPMNVFLRPLCIKLKECLTEGVNWVDPQTKQAMNSKIVAPLIIADAPARAQIQNIMSFNGRYGCNICEIRTVQAKKIVGKKTCRIYPFTVDSNIRTGKRMEEQARKLRKKSKEKDHIRGVKGFSILSCLPYMDIATCVLPEYMHSVLLGVIKQFINIWFQKKGPWNIKVHSVEMDDFISNIRPVQSFCRLPRKLTDYRFYKASEFYNFLFFYSLPTLTNYLPDKYLQHWILLIKASFNLLKDDIAQADLRQSESLLKLFVSQIESLYTDRELSYNTHQLLHLTLCVQRWGPLWATSAFPFENYNGFISKSAHGSKHFGQEIVNNLEIARGTQILKNRVIEAERNARVKTDVPRFEVLGTAIKNFDLDDLEHDIFSDWALESKNLRFFARMRINREIYTSEIYKVTKTNNHTVEVKTSDNASFYGSIRFFVATQNDFYFVIHCYTVEHLKMFYHLQTKTKIDHIIPIQPSGQFLLLSLKNISAISQLLRVGNYICWKPNSSVTNIW